MSDRITDEIVEKALAAGSIMSKGFTRIAMRNALSAVAADLVAAERERCAKIADDCAKDECSPRYIAAAIRQEPAP